jgi:hypothetical protein
VSDYQRSPNGRSSTSNDQAERSWWATWKTSSAIASGLLKKSSGLSGLNGTRVQGVSIAASTTT